MTHTILYLNAMGEISGAERSLLAMLDALDRDRWLPVVAAPEGSLLREVASRGVRTIPLALSPLTRPRTPGAYVATARALVAGRREVKRLIGLVKPQLVHANSTPAMFYAMHATSLPLVWQVRDLTPLGRWGALLYRRACRVAAISGAVREDLLCYAKDGGEKIVRLPPAVDTAHFHPADDKAAVRVHLGLPCESPLIGMVAQFVPWKRHHLFLDALVQMADHPWHAVLAGADFGRDDAYIASLRDRLAQPPLAGRVSWLPWQPDPAMLLASLDCCILTSQREPFGRVLIEAMACGVPVIAVEDGGARDIVIPGVTGLLTPADPSAIAEALASVIYDAELRIRLGRAARERALDSFSLSRQGADLSTLYQHILSAELAC
ncbi:MAG: glycosyltransferase family 4 protein [Armatimonadota bacterium]